MFGDDIHCCVNNAFTCSITGYATTVCH